MIYTVFDVVLSMLRIPFTGSGYKRLSMKRFKTRKTKNRGSMENRVGSSMNQADR